MINFEEELKKFGPSMEIEEVENAVRDHELTDMTDIMFAMIRQQNEAQAIPTPSQPMTTAQTMAAAPAMAAVPPIAPAQ